MEEKKYFKVLARDSKSGIGKDGMPYCFESLTIDFYGKSAKVGLSENMEVKPGHFVKLGFCTRRSYGCAEVVATAVEVLKQEVKGE